MVWGHLCTGTVLKQLPLFCKMTVLWNMRAEDPEGLWGALHPRSRPHPLAGLCWQTRSGSVPSPRFQPYAGHPWLPQLLVVSWERQLALAFWVPGEAWRPPCKLGLCSFNTLHPPPLSQLPRVTAQTLPSALRGDVIQARAQAYPELPAK